MTKQDLLKKIYYGDDSEFLTQYFETALWSTTDWPVDQDQEPEYNLDENYGIEDFTAVALKKMIDGAEGFLNSAGVREAIEVTGGDYSQAGHDFWLTREGHGAGFWDGDWPEPQATFLTNLSETAGEVDISSWRGKLHVD